MNGGVNGGVDLYLLAGVKTWPTYFLEPAERLRQMSVEAGYANAEVHVLYPYGDHTIPLARQLREVARDIVRRLALAADNLPLHDIADGRSGRSDSEQDHPTGELRTDGERLTVSGAAHPSRAAAAKRGATPAVHEQIVEAIRERSAGRVVVLIGHSGGGVAAYHAGRRLLAEGAVRDCRIVQVGSPKVRIHPALRNRTAWFYAADERGRLRDPITRFGTWGGIRRGSVGIPVWDPRRWAPGHIAAVAIEGGHKDYFLPGPSDARDRANNLERTVAAVFDWLVRSLRPAEQSSEAHQPSRQPSPLHQPSPT